MSGPITAADRPITQWRVIFPIEPTPPSSWERAYEELHRDALKDGRLVYQYRLIFTGHRRGYSYNYYGPMQSGLWPRMRRLFTRRQCFLEVIAPSDDSELLKAFREATRLVARVNVQYQSKSEARLAQARARAAEKARIQEALNELEAQWSGERPERLATAKLRDVKA